MIQIQLMHCCALSWHNGPTTKCALALNHLYDIVWEERLTTAASIATLHPKERLKHILRIISSK